MAKRALSAVAGFFGLCFSLSAQPTQSPEQYLFEGNTLNRSFLGLAPLSLADQERVSFMSAFTWQTPVDFLPPFNPPEPEDAKDSTTSERRNSADRSVEMRDPDRFYFSGQMGFLYGTSSGKYGRTDFQSYIFGTVGTDKFSITAGVLHQESSGHVPRWGR
jgi:hypothetical protein